MAKKGLGKGLDALFLSNIESAAEASGGVTSVKLTDIDTNANQPRKAFDEIALYELSDSIKQHGILQPLALRRISGGRYMIVAGERRFRASKLAGLTEVPAVIVDVSDRDAAELALVENLQREDLNPIEEAEGIKSLLEEFSLTQEEAAKRLGKSRPSLANALRLLALPEDALALLRDGKIDRGHAKVILSLPDKKRQSEAAKLVCERGLNVRQTEALVKRMLSGEPVSEKSAEITVNYVAELEKSLTKSLGRKVHLISGRKKGKIEIEYYGNDDLELLIAALKKLAQEAK